MTAPVAKLEIAPGIAATAEPAAGDWVDVSAYLRGFDLDRGRQEELDQIETGTATFTLDNRDRRFDPDYATGAYYPNVKPMMHIRFTEGGTSTRVFRGYVDTWRQSWPGAPLVNTDAVVTVPCSDAFKPLANFDLPRSDWEKAVRDRTPTWWYRLAEQALSTTIDDASGNGNLGAVVGPVTFGDTGLLAFDVDQAATLDGPPHDVNLPYQYFVIPRGIRSNPWSLVGLVKLLTPPQSPVPRLTLYSQYDPGGQFMRVNITTSGTVQVTWWPSSGTSHIATGSKYLYDGKPHVIIAVINSTSVTIYVDGVADGSTTYGADATTFPVTRVNRIGLNWPGESDSSNADQFLGTVDEMVLFDGTELSGADALALSNAALQPGNGQDTGARATVALDSIGWPAALRDIGVGRSIVQAHGMGTSALDYLSRLAVTEEGLLHVTRDGKVSFKSRDYLVTPSVNASALTFGDGGGSEIPYIDLVLDPGDEHIHNEARVSREGGAEFVIDDATSQTTYYKRTIDGRTDMLTQSDEEVRQHGNWLVYRYKNLRTTVSSLTVMLNDSRVDRAAVLSLTIGQVVTVKRRPPGGGTITKTARIEGIHMEAARDPVTWTVQFWLSGYDPAADQPLIWDDATYGKWDSSPWGF